jgi:hypothetical protein
MRAAVREAETGDEDQHRPEQRPRRQPKHGRKQVAVPAAGERVERQMHGDDDEERSPEEHAVVVEHARHRKCSQEHRDERDEQCGPDEAFLGVDGVRQPGVGGPGPPERRDH